MERFALLYTRPSSYTLDCLDTLKKTLECEILCIQKRPASEAPFSDKLLAGIAEVEYRDEFESAESIVERMVLFNPDCIYVSGWSDKAYLKAARVLRKWGFLVISGMDTQYTGKLRQKIAVLISRWYLHSAFDALWVPGERQLQFAKRLGYHGQKCINNVYCCNPKKFPLNISDIQYRKKSFIYIGRYVHRKGIDILLEGYRRYRASVPDPWELHCIGAGELEDKLSNEEGVINLGFVQPDKLPEILAGFGGFVLASRFEPWGVVVQEAAAAGLPLICSDVVGSAVHLLHDNYNGYIFSNESSQELSQCMQKLSDLSETERESMSLRSKSLGSIYSSELWVKTLTNGVKMLKK